MNWEEYSAKIFSECKKREVPFYACFELTPFCNFNCNFCYIRLTREQARAQGNLLSTEQWIHLAEEAKKMGTLSLEITGGEALCREDFPILYKDFIKKGFIINLRTNGYLLNGRILELLRKYKPGRIGITLYGASDKTYQKVCGVSDGFTTVVNNILVLREQGFNIHLTMTVTKDNNNDVPAVKQWAQKNGFHIRFYGGLFTPIRGAKRSIDHLKIENIYHLLDNNCETSSVTHTVQNRQFYMNPFWMCNGFGAMFCISWDGRMTICNSMTAVWKEPLTNGLSNAYHDLYRDLKKIQRPKKCESCQLIDYCGACPTRFLSETGSVDEVSDKICRRTQYVYNKLITNEGKNK